MAGFSTIFQVHWYRSGRRCLTRLADFVVEGLSVKGYFFIRKSDARIAVWLFTQNGVGSSAIGASYGFSHFSTSLLSWKSSSTWQSKISAIFKAISRGIVAVIFQMDDGFPDGRQPVGPVPAGWFSFPSGILWAWWWYWPFYPPLFQSRKDKVKGKYHGSAENQYHASLESEGVKKVMTVRIIRLRRTRHRVRQAPWPDWYRSDASGFPRPPF